MAYSTDELRAERDAAIKERDALQQEQRAIDQKIEAAIRQNARAKLDGTKPAATRNTVAKLRERKDELPIYIEAANQRVHESQLALIGAEMRVSQECSAELGAQLEEAREELKEVTKRVRSLEAATHAEGSRHFRLMERRSEVQRELAEDMQGASQKEPVAVQPVRW